MDRSAPSIDLEVRPSRALHLAVALVLVLAALALVLADLPRGFAIVLFAGALLASAYEWRVRHGRRARLILTSDGRWTVVRDGVEARASLEDAVELGPLLTMTLRGDDRRAHRFALLPDSADPAELRRLRVWLRHPEVGADRT